MTTSNTCSHRTAQRSPDQLCAMTTPSWPEPARRRRRVEQRQQREAQRRCASHVRPLSGADAGGRRRSRAAYGQASVAGAEHDVGPWSDIDAALAPGVRRRARRRSRQGRCATRPATYDSAGHRRALGDVRVAAEGAAAARDETLRMMQPAARRGWMALRHRRDLYHGPVTRRAGLSRSSTAGRLASRASRSRVQRQRPRSGRRDAIDARPRPTACKGPHRRASADRSRRRSGPDVPHWPAPLVRDGLSCGRPRRWSPPAASAWGRRRAAPATWRARRSVTPALRPLELLDRVLGRGPQAAVRPRDRGWRPGTGALRAPDDVARRSPDGWWAGLDLGIKGRHYSGRRVPGQPR